MGRATEGHDGPVQAAISTELMVSVEFDAAVEVERRVTFLVEHLAAGGLRGWVLGVSGGVDSSTAGRLCQLAAERVRADGGTYEQIDDFLEGREVPPDVHEIIVSTYRRTAHKRALPAAP